MKRHLVLSVTAALVLVAAAAFAQDFHPIADADYIGYPDTDTSFASHMSCDQPGPLSDSEWGPMNLTGADAAVLVAATFDPLVDADFLDTTGYEASTMVDVQCAKGN